MSPLPATTGDFRVSLCSSVRSSVRLSRNADPTITPKVFKAKHSILHMWIDDNSEMMHFSFFLLNQTFGCYGNENFEDMRTS